LVYGTLTAVGSSGNEVVFTSFTDDDFGGDSNGGGHSTGTPGYWGRIYFNNTSSSRLEHVKVRYGGYNSDGNIYMYNSAVPVISSEISDGSSFGIYSYDCSPLIQGNTISNNGSYGIYHRGYYTLPSPVDRNNTITGNSYGIYVQNATPTIDGNTITDNTSYGIYFTQVTNSPVITSNTITGNNKPVRLPFSSLPGPDAGNTLSPNTYEQIEFYGNTLSHDLTLTTAPVNLYYQVGGNVTVATGAKLTIEPGVVWKFASSVGIDVNGALYAVGGSSDSIVFTSYRDDEFGGDTNGGGFSTGQPGDWNRIYFSDSAVEFLTRLEHVKVLYGGSGGSGNINMNNSSVPVISSEISYGSSYGIYALNCSPLIQGNTISNNGSYGIYTWDGSPLIQVNTISNNGSYGIYHRGYYTLPSPVDLNNTITGNFGGIYVRYATPTIDHD
ncbi:MAG: right-handed parallel beta-helix repeat-containing protein, partial [Deltaproteobacteria bacterium]|nr:right-handed parallel beta-helix repeat-containing protein [Deltaproteobacteria bacterium]